MIITENRGAYAITTEIHARRLDGTIEIRKEKNEFVLPNGDSIILINYYSDKSPLTLHDHNHNIFRLDASGNVVWQVQRDDRGRINWDYIMGEVAKGEKGNPETIRHARKPFTSLSPFFIRHGKYQDSGDNAPPLLECDKSLVWSADFVLIAGAGGECYELDVESGQATNISTWRGREW